MKNKSKFGFLAAAYLGIVPSFSLENTNISGYDDQYQIFDHNRLRGELIVDHDTYSDLSATLIVDNESLYIEDPGGLRNKTSIYRAYLEYKGSKHYWILGKQRIPLGVGRFWNPMDVFNPIDIQAIEPNERPGTDSIHYEYALSQLSNIDATVAKAKGILRMKGYLDFADVAFVAEWDDSQNLDIIGWELEGELAETGIEFRTEGGSFHNRDNGLRHTELIVGAEYGFVSSLVLTGEYHFLDASDLEEFAVSASFQPTMLWTCYLTNVVELDDCSGFISPVVEYALSDEMTLSGGAFIYHGDESSIYGFSPDRFYIRWFIHF